MALHLDHNARDFTRALALNPRNISEERMRQFEGYMAEMFAAFGMDMSDPDVAATPRRYVRALYDATSGYEGDPKLLTVFDKECVGGPDCHLSQIIEGPIPFFALCEHHSLPFHGNAYIGYIAHEHLLGVSKLTRLVRLFARRFTLQERLGQQIADTLDAMLQPHGVAVYLEAQHLCTQMRGVREVSPQTRTTFWRGVYADDAAVRAEFIAASGLRG
jgi:GTP cyclohydrolase IA